MNAISLKDLKPDTYYTSPVYLDDSYILLSPETPMTSSMINRLAEWEFREVYTEGDIIAFKKDEIGSAIEASNEEIDSSAKSTLTVNDAEHLNSVITYYKQFVSYIETFFTKYVQGNGLSLQELSDKVKALCDIVLEHKKYMLRIIADESNPKNYLVEHSAKTAVLSIVVGSHLKLPVHHLIKLGVAAVVHEIGMIRLPPQIYMAPRKLSDKERKAMSAHPILGYNILKEQQFPLAICLAALEHHERLNGQGYPRALTDEKISQYARIIAVTCSYEAITASRPYKDSGEGYQGIVSIIKNEGKQYDDMVIKALVYSLSVYPIGSYVQLSNRKYAQVIDTNPANPRCPIVNILGTRTPDGKEIVVKTSENGVRILKPLQKEEAEKILAAIKQGQQF